jgi:hypothetical protein
MSCLAMSVTRLRTTFDAPRCRARYIASRVFPLLRPRIRRGVALAAIPCSLMSRAKSSRHARSIALSMCSRRPSSLSALTTTWTCGCCWSVWSYVEHHRVSVLECEFLARALPRCRQYLIRWRRSRHREHDVVEQLCCPSGRTSVPGGAVMARDKSRCQSLSSAFCASLPAARSPSSVSIASCALRSG